MPVDQSVQVKAFTARFLARTPVISPVHEVPPVESRVTSRNIAFQTSDLVTDRASSFLARAVLGITTMADVEGCVAAIQGLVSQTEPAHPCIRAWVLPNGQRGWDDDGEQYAGKKILAAVITHLRPGEGCFAAVTRWYGGILLGPVRFQHIAVCTHDAMRKARLAFK